MQTTDCPPTRVWQEDRVQLLLGSCHFSSKSASCSRTAISMRRTSFGLMPPPRASLTGESKNLHAPSGVLTWMQPSKTCPTGYACQSASANTGMVQIAVAWERLLQLSLDRYTRQLGSSPNARSSMQCQGSVVGFRPSPPRCRKAHSGSVPRDSRCPYSEATHLHTAGRRKQLGSSARC